MSILSPYSIYVGAPAFADAAALTLCREGMDYLARWPEFSGTQEIFEAQGIKENHAAIIPLGAASVTMILEVEEEYATHQEAMKGCLSPHLFKKKNLLLGEWSLTMQSDIFGQVLAARVVFESVVATLDFLAAESTTLRRTYTLLLGHEEGDWTVPAEYNRGGGSTLSPWPEAEDVGQPVLNLAIADQLVRNKNSFFFQLPENTFYDPNGDALKHFK